jgi:hypothetical protein
VKIGDIVRIKTDASIDASLLDETGYGIVIGFEPRGYQSDRDPDCDVWNDAIVVWPRTGKSWHMRALLEVLNESR